MYSGLASAWTEALGTRPGLSRSGPLMQPPHSSASVPPQAKLREARIRPPAAGRTALSPGAPFAAFDQSANLRSEAASLCHACTGLSRLLGDRHGRRFAYQP